MRHASRTVTVTTVATFGLLTAGLATMAGLSQVGSGAAPSTTASTPLDASTTTGGLTTTPLVSVSTPQSAPSTTIDGFADGAAASAAAEDVLVGYIASQHDLEVTDPACSEPASGAVGERFVCYALKSGDLVIALRATVREQRLITLELVTNQVATTTTTTITTTTVAVEPTAATETPATTEA